MMTTTNDLKVLLYVLLAMGATMLCAGWGMAAVAETAVAWWGVPVILVITALWIGWLELGHGRLPGALPWLALALLLSGAGALWVSEAGVVWTFLGVLGVVAAWDVRLVLRPFTPPHGVHFRRKKPHPQPFGAVGLAGGAVHGGLYRLGLAQPALRL